MALGILVKALTGGNAAAALLVGFGVLFIAIFGGLWVLTVIPAVVLPWLMGFMWICFCVGIGGYVANN